MALNRRQFDQWLRRQLSDERDDEGKCIKLVVRHVGVNKRLEGEVDTISLKKKFPTQDEFTSFCEETANRIDATTHADASGVGGTQSYTIQAFFERSENAVSRFTFRVLGDDEEGNDIVRTADERRLPRPIDASP